MYLKLINNPELFQGRKKQNEYFEGWYFKHTNKKGDTISFIPGISLNKGDEHCFIQIIYSQGCKVDNFLKTYYIRYKITEFKYQDEPFGVQIANNTFSLEGCNINIDKSDLNLKADLKYKDKITIKKNLISPNIMGAFGYIPFMECFHGVLSMDHKVDGKIKINDIELDFKNSKGYIEKDWGSSFPKDYVWIQGNDFEEEKTSIFVSVAKIPFLSKSFTGHICNFIHKGIEYRFATYNLSKIIKINQEKEEIEIIFLSKGHTLKIKGEMCISGELLAPQKGRMDNIIKEGLGGKVWISLSNSKNVIFEGKSNLAGVEIVGNIKELSNN